MSKRPRVLSDFGLRLRYRSRLLNFLRAGGEGGGGWVGAELINIFGFSSRGQRPLRGCVCGRVSPVAPPLSVQPPHYPLLSDARLSCIMQKEQGGSH